MRIILLLLLFTSVPASALACVPSISTWEERLQNAEHMDYIFIGRVKDINDGGLYVKTAGAHMADAKGAKQVTFKVIQNFKGANESTIVTASMRSDCSQTFIDNEKYLIFMPKQISAYTSKDDLNSGIPNIYSTDVFLFSEIEPDVVEKLNTLFKEKKNDH